MDSNEIASLVSSKTASKHQTTSQSRRFACFESLHYHVLYSLVAVAVILVAIMQDATLPNWLSGSAKYNLQWWKDTNCLKSTPSLECCRSTMTRFDKLVLILIYIVPMFCTSRFFILGVEDCLTALRCCPPQFVVFHFLCMGSSDFMSRHVDSFYKSWQKHNGHLGFGANDDKNLLSNVNRQQHNQQSTSPTAHFFFNVNHTQQRLNSKDWTTRNWDCVNSDVKLEFVIGLKLFSSSSWFFSSLWVCTSYWY